MVAKKTDAHVGLLKEPKLTLMPSTNVFKQMKFAIPLLICSSRFWGLPSNTLYHGKGWLNLGLDGPSGIETAPLQPGVFFKDRAGRSAFIRA